MALEIFMVACVSIASDIKTYRVSYI